MKGYLVISLVVVLAACQTTTEPKERVEQPVASSGISDERRAELDRCLIQIGKDPLPEILDGINAPMNSEEAKAFNECMNSQ